MFDTDSHRFFTDRVFLYEAFSVKNTGISCRSILAIWFLVFEREIDIGRSFFATTDAKAMRFTRKRVGPVQTLTQQIGTD